MNRIVDTDRYVECDAANSTTYSYEFGSILRDIGSTFGSVLDNLVRNSKNEPSDKRYNMYDYKLYMDTKPSSSVYPKTINHIAVPNLEEAMKWYTEILGFRVIKQPVEFVADDSIIGIAVKDIHGPTLKKMRMAWLSSANQVGLEI